MAIPNPSIDQALAELRAKQAAIEKGEPPVGVGSEDLGDLTGTEFGEKLAAWREKHPEKPEEKSIAAAALSTKPFFEVGDCFQIHEAEQEPEKPKPSEWIVGDEVQDIEIPPLPYSVTKTLEENMRQPGRVMPMREAPLIGSETEQELNRMSEEIDRLLNLLRRAALHVAARNAIGEMSKDFCCACNNARHEACVLPEIWKAVGEL